VNDGTARAVTARPVATNGRVYAGSHDARAYAFDAETGDREWTLETDDVVSPPVPTGQGVVVASQDGGVYAVDPPGETSEGRSRAGRGPGEPRTGSGSRRWTNGSRC
jgi:outer membrane protein assembly factor BamB